MSCMNEINNSWEIDYIYFEVTVKFVNYKSLIIINNNNNYCVYFRFKYL